MLCMKLNGATFHVVDDLIYVKMATDYGSWIDADLCI
jgi:hypothetical protein